MIQRLATNLAVLLSLALLLLSTTAVVVDANSDSDDEKDASISRRRLEAHPKYKKAASGKGIADEYLVLVRVNQTEIADQVKGKRRLNNGKGNNGAGGANNGNGSDKSQAVRDNVRNKVEKLVGAEATVAAVFGDAIEGVALTGLKNKGAIQRLLKSDDILLLEENQVVQKLQTQDVDATGDDIWGLDRIDQASSTRDGYYNYGSLTGNGYVYEKEDYATIRLHLEIVRSFSDFCYSLAPPNSHFPFHSLHQSVQSGCLRS